MRAGDVCRGIRDDDRERKKFPARRPMTSIFLAGFLGALVGAAVTWSVVTALATGRIHWKSRPRRMTVCPACSGPAEGFAPDDKTEEGVNPKPDTIMVCPHVISESPFEECGFSVSRSLFDIPWLRVHGVGGTCNAGQTMWNAACFGLVEPFCTTKQVEVETIPCAGSEEPRRTWDDVYLHRSYPRATSRSHTPHPWLMQVRQADSRSHRLAVAVSDFAGEFAAQCTPVDSSYRQLLDAESHLFFVDPAAVQEENHQLGVFHRFLVNVRSQRGLEDSNKPIGPIAVCIPKCDLLAHYIGRAHQATQFIQQMRSSGPCDVATTLTAIKRRHELVVKHAGILPCIETLARRLQTDCGPDGFMFFPMTAVGWSPDDMANDGTHSLANRPIAPWGVLDPLLWLIHASGFEALPA